MAMTIEVKLASAQIGDFLVTGDVEVEFDYSVSEDTTEIDGRYRRIEKEIYIDYVYDVVPIDIVIEHPNWNEEVSVNDPDFNPSDYNLWNYVLNNLPDEWWNDEIVYNNNLWEYIDD